MFSGNQNNHQKHSFVWSDSAKIFLLFAAFCIVILAIIVRFVFIYKATHKARYTRHIAMDGYKNPILSAEGDFIAISIKTQDLYIDPNIVLDKPKTLKILQKYFKNLEQAEIKRKLEKTSWILVQRSINQKTLHSLIEEGLIGIKLQDSFKRIYPEDSLFSHIVGYTNIDGEGLAGVEKYYNDALYENSVSLSLNRAVQSIVHDELVGAVRKFRAKSAFAVIMDIKTGEIISSVSIPDFNPNNIQNSSGDAMRNAVSASALELGSVFKLFTLAFALENGVSEDYKIRTKDGIKIEGGRVIRDEHSTADEMSVSEVFYKSSNVGSGIMSLMFGDKKFVEFLTKLGVYKKLSTNLPEGEIASPIFNKNDFSRSRIITTSYGYGVSLSALHFLAIANGIINDGKYLPPTFIKNGNKGISPVKIVSKQTSQKAIEIANKVVTEGTARRAAIAGYKICGKTGTSQKYDPAIKGWSTEKKLLSFFSIFPCSNPKYVMYLAVDEPKPTPESNLHIYANLYGGTVSAPVSSKIISVISPMLNIQTDKE